MPYETNRRDLLALSAATALGAALPFSPAHAAAPPPVGRQVAGVFRRKVGDFEVTMLHDGVRRVPLDQNFVPATPVADVQAALAAAFLPTDAVEITFTVMAVNTGKNLVLFDAGTGGQLAPTARGIGEAMQAAGLDPKAVTDIVHSHFHADHITGVRTKEGELAFANAQIHVPEAEWAYWNDDAELSRAAEFRKGNFALVKKIFGPVASKLNRYAANTEVIPGITAIPAYGHTPGHTVFQIASGKDVMINIIDTTNRPELFLRHPDWSAAVDQDGPMARETRKKLLDRIVADKALIAGYHFPFPANAYVTKTATGYDFVPTFWSTL